MSENETPNGPDQPDTAPDRPREPARTPARERLGGEIDVAALQSVKQRSAEDLDVQKSRPVWEDDDAPAGSTGSSLLVYERGKPVRVSGPTHYHHLTDGRVVAGYGGGTTYSEPGEDGGPDKISRIVAIHEG